MEDYRRSGDLVLDQLKQDFDDHRVEFGVLRSEFAQHLLDEREDRKESHRVQRDNAQNISNLTVAMTDLTKTVQAHIDATSPVVKKYRDIEGAARVSDDILDRIVKWSKVGGIVSVAAAFLLWVIEHLPKH